MTKSNVRYFSGGWTQTRSINSQKTEETYQWINDTLCLIDKRQIHGSVAE